eukprot:TRINITY_DN10117_c0_g1_i2.p2 TRINITY_DN10117_c0_g1~~TRINITY_DN10117_c0_g1_i2.p2  ORF type:complete len:132 (+),score=25.36 TRINITY_DN10117_c0_g1_i2:114-509(+)
MSSCRGFSSVVAASPSGRAKQARRGAYIPAAVFALMLVALLIDGVAAKPKKYGGSQTSKVHWKKENECTKTACKMIHPDENDDCLAKCVSEACYAEVYGTDPLEPGEIDRPRTNKFNACVKKEGEDAKTKG